MFKKFFIFILFIFCFLAAFAQANIELYVDKNELDLSEELQLTITVKADSADVEISDLPSLPNFNIYSSGQSRNVSMINGKVNVTQQFNYILMPRFAGKSVIDPFTVKVAGKTYHTEPVEIEVHRSETGNAEASLVKKNNNSAKHSNEAKPKENSTKNEADMPAFFMVAKTDKTKAYINEQINLKIRFYQSQNTVGKPMYERPKMEGLVFEELSTESNYEAVGGKQYVYTEFNIAAFGILPGNATIGAASVEYNVAGDIFDPFYSFFSSNRTSNTKRVSSKPINIEIMPLPQAGKPKTFYNAVGTNYSLKASVDNPAPQAGEPITLSLALRGEGNMRSVGDIPIPDLGKSFRIYETTSSFENKITGSALGGSKVYKTVIVPRASGNFTIPAIEFSYFDTKSKVYKTVKSNPITLEVSPSDTVSSAPLTFAAGAVHNQNGGVEQIVQDIRYIKEGKISVLSRLLVKTGAWGIWNLAALFILAIAILIYNLSGKDIPVFSKKKAFLKAKKDLAKAKTVSEVSQILTGYIESKLGKPIGIRSIADCAAKLRLSDETSSSLGKLWQEFEMLKYAPSGTVNSTVAAEDAANRTLLLIQEIEKEVK